MTAAPTAQEQIAFILKLQRLFSEGEFSATYKFALLLALAELAVEYGDDSGAALSLPMAKVGEKFAELYWRQVPPYSSGLVDTVGETLHQNKGAVVAIMRPLRQLHALSHGQWSQVRALSVWPACLKAICQTVRDMPLKHLQMLGGQLDPFLYTYPCPPDRVVLNAGVAFNLRRYQELVQQLAKAGWLEHVRSNKLNRVILGMRDDLETFMFGSARADLSEVAKVLGPLQQQCCFYCQQPIKGKAQVDHFIPWSRYPRDTAHNFVLAHAACNRSKRDMLAAKSHLERWLAHLSRYGDEQGALLAQLGFVSDQRCSLSVAEWAYQSGVQAQALAWREKSNTEAVEADCLALF